MSTGLPKILRGDVAASFSQYIQESQTYKGNITILGKFDTYLLECLSSLKETLKQQKKLQRKLLGDRELLNHKSQVLRHSEVFLQFFIEMLNTESVFTVSFNVLATVLS